MSFNYKPKIIIKSIDSEKLFEQYEQYTKNTIYKKFFSSLTEEIKQCQYCKNHIGLGNTIFGIPVSIKEVNTKLIVDICGTYCSFKCVNDHFVILDSEISRKRNIKYTDSGPLIKILNYKFYKKFDNLDIPKNDIDIEKLNIEFKYSPSNIIS